MPFGVMFDVVLNWASNHSFFLRVSPGARTSRFQWENSEQSGFGSEMFGTLIKQ